MLVQSNNNFEQGSQGLESNYDLYTRQANWRAEETGGLLQRAEKRMGQRQGSSLGRGNFEFVPR